jgi:hypothetical protein
VALLRFCQTALALHFQVDKGFSFKNPDCATDSWKRLVEWCVGNKHTSW